MAEVDDYEGQARLRAELEAGWTEEDRAEVARLWLEFRPDFPIVEGQR